MEAKIPGGNGMCFSRRKRLFPWKQSQLLKLFIKAPDLGQNMFGKRGFWHKGWPSDFLGSAASGFEQGRVLKTRKMGLSRLGNCSWICIHTPPGDLPTCGMGLVQKTPLAALKLPHCIPVLGLPMEKGFVSISHPRPYCTEGSTAPQPHKTQ